jgi:DNA invertase Pin-like site-specific DNA recombinase
MTTRVAIYARVSTVNHGQDVGLQTRELRQFVEARGWNVAGEYIDSGVSGAKDSRPELNRLMADAHRRRFDVVCVWRFDRFARSVSHLLRTLETFKALRIDFVSYSEQMDTSTPAGKMVFTVLGAVAEFESDRRACEGRLAECKSERKTHRKTHVRCGCFSDCPAACL